MAGVTAWHKEFILAPMPTKGKIKRGGGGGTYVDSEDRVIDLEAIEQLLEAQHEEGFTCFLPLDLTQPAILFTRSTRRATEEYIDEVLDRMDAFDDLEFDGVAPSQAVIRKVVAATIERVY